ncbi:Uma2 family endonuclease [Granulicella aggregans]|uniref:Uma2 family endonuclease n=1 Tax=Granulicella aggregans TaxID=474949 RepID=UPI0021E004E2|nr:Uma2 family endonuclease [Granulicella aggregans]
MPIDWVPEGMISQEEGPISVFVSEEEYLGTVYRPECDYVDGRLTDRNIGEWNHSRVMTTVMCLLAACENEREWYVLPACRTEVAPGRYRCPDVQVVSRFPKIDRIVRRPPLLVVEVISPHDTWHRLRTVFKDWLAMGVEHVWAFEPAVATAYRVDLNGMWRVREPELSVPGTQFRLVLYEVFATD